MPGKHTIAVIRAWRKRTGGSLRDYFKAQGLCPDCKGRGYISGSRSPDCYGCGGTGVYEKMGDSSW